MVRFCTNCGSPLEEDTKFCVKCGSSIPKDVLKRSETTKDEISPSKKR